MKIKPRRGFIKFKEETMTLFKMKEQLTAIGAELRSVSEGLRELVTNGAAPIDEVREKQKYQGEIQERFDLLKSEIEKEERDVKINLADNNQLNPAATDEQRKKAATGEFVRSTLLGGDMSNETRNLLHAIPAPNASGGEKLLPVNLQNELIHEPFARNQLRPIVQTTSIKGLERPKIAYELDDDDFITDTQTAKELELKGDKVTFGRFKMKIKARISDTVMHGSDLNLGGYVQNALNSGMAAKEKKVMLTETPKPAEGHMSFYSTGNAIKKVTGTDMYAAITNALADLHEDYRDNAKIVMKFSDYIGILIKLANNSTALFSAPPESILGKPTVFCDNAVNPIVGDFNFTQINYDGPIVYDTDKNVEKGEYLFVITAWYDVQILLKSAFRIAAIGV
jgi:HK97 family phage major capsid protein